MPYSYGKRLLMMASHRLGGRKAFAFSGREECRRSSFIVHG
jgi:hypothetical protein